MNIFVRYLSSIFEVVLLFRVKPISHSVLDVAFKCQLGEDQEISVCNHVIFDVSHQTDHSFEVTPELFMLKLSHVCDSLHLLAYVF